MKKDYYWVTYLYPLRIITHENEKIEFTLDQINDCTYNHGLLCRVVGEVQNTFRNRTLTYLVCGDGALALLRNDAMSNNDIILNYNDFLCKLMLGGLDVEAINIKDVTTGSMDKPDMIWPVDFGRGYNSHLHALLRMRLTSNVDAIRLLGAASNAITITDFAEYLEKGSKIVNSIGNLSTFYLLSGVSDMRYGDWSSALSNLWIVAEQITDFLWMNRFLNDPNRNPEIPSRKQTLKTDHRTYSASVKQEILYQVGIIPEKVYAQIYDVRKARNKLVHEGTLADKNVAANLYDAVNNLIQIAAQYDITNILPSFDTEDSQYY